MHKLALVLIFALAAFAQEVERTFPLTIVSSATAIANIVTTLRTVALITEVSADPAKATVTVKGTPSQIALAEWLVPKLDVTPSADTQSQEYRVDGNSADVVTLFQLAHTKDSGLQEALTTLRTALDLQKIYATSAPAIIAARGNANQIAMAEWLVPKLDVATPAQPGFMQYRATGNSDDVLDVFTLAPATPINGLQEIVTTLRTVVDNQKVYNMTALRMVIVRGSASLTSASEIVISELDRSPQTRQVPSVHRFHLTGDVVSRGNDTLMVYGLAHTGSRVGIQEIITTLRTVLDVQKIYQVTGPAYLALRGTESGTQTAEWLIAKLDVQTGAAGMETPVPGGNELLHVFYLTHLTGGKAASEILSQLSAATHMTKMYYLSTPAALILRGTADQIAMAAQIVGTSDNAGL